MALVLISREVELGCFPSCESLSILNTLQLYTMRQSCILGLTESGVESYIVRDCFVVIVVQMYSVRP